MLINLDFYYTQHLNDNNAYYMSVSNMIRGRQGLFEMLEYAKNLELIVDSIALFRNIFVSIMLLMSNYAYIYSL